MNERKPLAGRNIGKVDPARIRIFAFDAQASCSVAIHDIDVPRYAFPPSKAYRPIIVDAQAIAGRDDPRAKLRDECPADARVVALFRRVDGEKLASARLLIWFGKTLTK